jgi:hypothetical protein
MSLGIFSEATDGAMCPGIDLASESEYQDTPGGKGDDLTTFIVPKVKKMRSLNRPEHLRPLRPVAGHLYLSGYQREDCAKPVRSAEKKKSEPQWCKYV